jgi:hypothetical protein
MGGGFRLAEVVAVLAMATDLGLGLPMEHAVWACLLSTEIGRRAGLPGEELSDLYYLTLLRMLGCTADSGYHADLFGDEVAFARDTQHLDYGNPTIPRLGLPAGSELTVPVPPASSRAGSKYRGADITADLRPAVALAWATCRGYRCGGRSWFGEAAATLLADPGLIEPARSVARSCRSARHAPGAPPSRPARAASRVR